MPSKHPFTFERKSYRDAVCNERQDNSQKSGCINHSYARIFQVMTTSVRRIVIQVLAFQKSWRSFSPITVCIIIHVPLPPTERQR